jgi:transcriptional regulator with XRE-family HTH domain
VSDDYARIGRAISAGRRAAGLTQQQLADVAGLTRSSIANCEAGRQRIPSAKLAIIATMLGTTTSQLLGETAVQQSRIPTELAARFTGQQREITRLLSEMSAVLGELAATSARMEELLVQAERGTT